jgi:hypothetical protein
LTNDAGDKSPIFYARLAGLLALVALITGSFAGFVSTKLVIPGDAAATAKNILASESLLRFGFVSGLAMYAIFIVYVSLLYKLLKPTDKNHALLMLLFALTGVPIAMLNHINQSAALLLLSGDEYLKAFTSEQIQAQMMLFLKLQSHGNLIAGIFWGVWLFPLGLLVFKSGYFPRILGVILMIGCLGWLLLFIQRFLLPNYQALGYFRYIAHTAELSWMLWLLVKGVDVEKWEKRALESSNFLNLR